MVDGLQSDELIVILIYSSNKEETGISVKDKGLIRRINCCGRGTTTQIRETVCRYDIKECIPSLYCLPSTLSTLNTSMILWATDYPTITYLLYIILSPLHSSTLHILVPLARTAVDTSLVSLDLVTGSSFVYHLLNLTFP